MYSISGYGSMIADRVRMAAYEAALRRAVRPGCVVLDLGAGTGIVGELASAIGISAIIGLDSLDAARAACLRDRPGVYGDYLDGDLAAPPRELCAMLERHGPNADLGRGARRHARVECRSRQRARLPCDGRSGRAHDRRALDATRRARRLSRASRPPAGFTSTQAVAPLALPAPSVDQREPDPVRTHRGCHGVAGTGP